MSFSVRITFSKASPLWRFGQEAEILDHITEIHYQYHNGKIAFESGVNGTGCTYDLDDIKEIEAVAEEAAAC